MGNFLKLYSIETGKSVFNFGIYYLDMICHTLHTYEI